MSTQLIVGTFNRIERPRFQHLNEHFLSTPDSGSVTCSTFSFPAGDADLVQPTTATGAPDEIPPRVGGYVIQSITI